MRPNGAVKTWESAGAFPIARGRSVGAARKKLCPQSALVSRVDGLLAQPGRNLGQSHFQQEAAIGIPFRPLFALPRSPSVIGVRDGLDARGRKHQETLAHLIEQIAVVTHHDDGTRLLFQRPLHYPARGDVEMIGWFVQQQATGDQAGKA